MRPLRIAVTSARGRPRMHRCPAPRCQIYVPMHRLACNAHWFALPEELRGQINSTYRRDPRAHLQHFREAIRLLHSLPANVSTGGTT